jgi:hypothetical protein
LTESAYAESHADGDVGLGDSAGAHIDEGEEEGC